MQLQLARCFSNSPIYIVLQFPSDCLIKVILHKII